jgi:hypothetical protein
MLANGDREDYNCLQNLSLMENVMNIWIAVGRIEHDLISHQS